MLSAISSIAVLLLLGYIIVLVTDKATKRKLANITQGRAPHTDDGFYDQFFASSDVPRDIVTKVRSIFRDNIPADISAVTADDDFSEDFRLIWMLDSMADVEILVGLEKAFGITIEDSEAENIKSIRNVVDLVWRKLQTESTD